VASLGGGVMRVVLTGAESTGKSVLAEALAAHFGAPWVPELSRDYAERAARPLTAGDVEPIARGQMAAEDVAVGELVILDTDLVSTVVYSRHHYGSCPEWIERAAAARRADLYLLLDIDVPWEADGVRDAGVRREALHRQFEAALGAIGARVVTIGGDWEERRRRAIAAIQATR
jgi:NadR type nicotinamide-nucleotide adenylyltransferase